MGQQISSSDKPVTMAILQEFYQQIYPYLGGNKAVDSHPVSTVIAYMGITPPAGYLLCDGSKLSAKAFPLLFDVLKEIPSSTRSTWGDADWVTEFNVPNLQGEFLRGAGTNSHTNQGNGGSVGTHQDGTEIPSFGYYHQAGTTSPYIFLGDVSDKATSPSSNVFITSKKVDKSIRPDGTGKSAKIVVDQTYSAENDQKIAPRPTNTSVLFCIKYTYVTQEEELALINSGSVIGPSEIIPLMDGTAAIGSSDEYARADHVHPSDTSKQDKLTASNGISITNNTISTDNMPSADLSEIVDPLPSVMSRRFTYSTDEQEVAKWINGKPVYQKTVDCSGLPAAGQSKEYTTNINNLGMIIDFSGFLYRPSNGASKMLPYCDGVNGTYIGVEVGASGNLRLVYASNGTDLSPFSVCYITIRYTKTTD